MIAVLRDHGLAFVGVPKCMTTTILRLFYERQYGIPYDPADHGGAYVHDFWTRAGAEAGLTHEPPSLDLLAGTERFTVIRDPVARLLSAYVNRVADHREIARAWQRPGWLARNAARAEGLVPQPDPDFFFANLARYRDLLGSIRHHTDPFAVFLGPDLAAYDRVFRIGQADDIRAYLGARLGGAVVLKQRQKGSRTLRLDDLSAPARRAIREATRADYDLLGAHYAPPGLAPVRPSAGGPACATP